MIIFKHLHINQISVSNITLAVDILLTNKQTLKLSSVNDCPIESIQTILNQPISYIHKIVSKINVINFLLRDYFKSKICFILSIRIGKEFPPTVNT